MAESSPTVVATLRTLTGNPNCKKYVYLGSDVVGWNKANYAKNRVPGLQIFQVESADIAAVRTEFGVTDAQVVALVFGYSAKPFAQLKPHEANSTATVIGYLRIAK